MRLLLTAAASLALLVTCACAHAETIQEFIAKHGSNSPFDHAQNARNNPQGCDSDVVRAGGYFIGGTFYPVECHQFAAPKAPSKPPGQGG